MVDRGDNCTRRQLSEEHNAKVRALRAALIAGGQSGTPAPFDIEAFIARKRGMTG